MIFVQFIRKVFSKASSGAKEAIKNTIREIFHSNLLTQKSATIIRNVAKQELHGSHGQEFVKVGMSKIDIVIHETLSYSGRRGRDDYYRWNQSHHSRMGFPSNKDKRGSIFPF